ncbi:alkene reductase [Flocculibacter collagenilyticus]|uniref:alkene reductase n=1 Tax=Flocculibacter collagenilyticus TaxID=2744479 RepID=UPI0018F63A42|nr:alkene reductase [Flocculibacter collagenilyticus]
MSSLTRTNEKQPLFSPINLGGISLNNRIIMAPLARSRADDKHLPNNLMQTYYQQRATAGLIITEATMVQQGHSAFINEPGIYSDEQIVGWRKITDAVHKEGGKIVMQLWHGGRTCHPLLNDGKAPVAPSAIPITNEKARTPFGEQEYTTPRALTVEEILEVESSFEQAAINAKLAGFDGVEVHAANGYLLDTFLRDGSNKRNDLYGGSIENRARIVTNILDKVISIWGSDKVGIRLSPSNSFNSMHDSDPLALTVWLAKKLSKYNLAYLHLMRSDFLSLETADILTAALEHYSGNLISNMGYDYSEANKSIIEGGVDAISFGRPFIANPDLVARFKTSAPLNVLNENTIYTAGPEGYVDYPTMA